MTIDEIVAQIINIRDQLAELTRQEDELKQQRASLESSLMDQMATIGVASLRTTHGTATMSKQQKAVLTNFDELMGYIIATGHTQLVQKRIAAKAYGELLEAGEEVPGVTVIEEFAISIRRS